MPYIIKNGKTYTGNSVSLTQAQYDALSTEEKNNGTVYYIYDSDTLLDASDVSLGSGNVEDLAGSVATIETSPATASHAVGSYIVYNGQLYKVTSAIDSGQTLTPGTNITATTAGAELTSLNNNLTNYISSVSFTGTTNTAGYIEGAIGIFGLPSKAVVLSVYFERGSYTARRMVNYYMYGSAGIGFQFLDNGSPVNNGSVTATIYYVVKN